MNPSVKSDGKGKKPPKAEKRRKALKGKPKKSGRKNTTGHQKKKVSTKDVPQEGHTSTFNENIEGDEAQNEWKRKYSYLDEDFQMMLPYEGHFEQDTSSKKSWTTDDSSLSLENHPLVDDDWFLTRYFTQRFETYLPNDDELSDNSSSTSSLPPSMEDFNRLHISSNHDSVGENRAQTMTSDLPLALPNDTMDLPDVFDSNSD